MRDGWRVDRAARRRTGAMVGLSVVTWLLAMPALAAAPAAPATVPATREACEAAGGRWGRFGIRQQELCDLPAADAGKVCADGRDCLSACVARDSAPAGSKSDGTCYPRMLLLGACLKQVRGGVVTPPLCAD